ncbi:MAG: hypothetical protein B6U69_03750 [Thermofilum sp. ex4484_15]|nr:MAG: hypothetical protein B6U69_03750 [Thermofilum sp. ex4484_15]
MKTLIIPVVLVLLLVPLALATPEWITGNIYRYATASGGYSATFSSSFGDVVESFGVAEANGAFGLNGWTSFTANVTAQLMNYTGVNILGAEGGQATGWFTYTNPALGASSGWSFYGATSLNAYNSYTISSSPYMLNNTIQATGLGVFGTGSVWYWNPNKPWQAYYERHRLYGNFSSAFSYAFTSPTRITTTPITYRPVFISPLSPVWP